MPRRDFRALTVASLVAVGCVLGVLTSLSSHGRARHEALLASDSKIMTQLFPEIPDPHPDPDPWPYPGHPARSPISKQQDSKRMARTQIKSEAEDRLGITAQPALGRAHGCRPEQIVVFPEDDCDPLTEKMKPGIQKWNALVAAQTSKTLGGVHWNSGDTHPSMDAFPLHERHGGYSGFGFQDVYYDSSKGVHPTLYRSQIGYSKHPRVMGTKQVGSVSQLKLQRVKADIGHQLIGQGKAELKAAQHVDTKEAIRLYKDATGRFREAAKLDSLRGAMDSLNKIEADTRGLYGVFKGVDAVEEKRLRRVEREMRDVKQVLSQ
ncbi:hypothetical protein GUITHDRAFT_154053 [Guillardia theta CCMP2712]|uniref:Uncharacterized protein n=1 Tax=Guillardia theta (strain CCMP2712) TaxID=905079 RepID=L1IXS8_GUITC|nr:hypothetical protein GUITHDRAFT_154053 [Guillardia theta CCMP2712]EKX40684.1 hypothetical protein GUITHDRAFT_154053 [Guillardia theta CCMP2712]|eukprot:XP_005827664.1 hypothetical protein GUITHDRAFT_154053 [Guillardia theta CCMP2712]